MWLPAKVGPRLPNGKFDRDAPLRPFDLTVPGAGERPVACSRSRIIDFKLWDSETNTPTYKEYHGWVTCDEWKCPLCHTTAMYTAMLRAGANLLQASLTHSGTKIYHLRFTLTDSGNVVSPDILSKRRRDCINYIKSFEGVYGGVSILHHVKLRRSVEKRIVDTFQSLYDRHPTRTELYEKCADMAFLKSECGYSYEHAWQVFDTLYHFHVYVVCDHVPVEIWIHGNSKLSKSLHLRGGCAGSGNFPDSVSNPDSCLSI